MPSLKPRPNCLQCGRPITQAKGKYCSYECYIARCEIDGVHNTLPNRKKYNRPPCLYCGELTKRPTTKYCSVECRVQDWKEKGIHFGGPKRKVPERTCPQCGKVFWRSYRSQYCSSKCMGEYRRDTGQIDEFIAMAKANTGPRDLSPETREKMSRAAANRDPKLEYTRGIGGIRSDIGHHTRSSWEANWARYLKFQGVSYEYEEEIFVLDDNGKPYRYRPDFKVGSTFYEIKGWWTERSKKSRKLMEEQHPDVHVIYIGKDEYRKVEKEYGHQIPNWEFAARRRK